MMIMGNQKKIYFGAIDAENEAALIYDKVSILIHGMKVSYCFFTPPHSYLNLQIYLKKFKGFYNF